MTTLSFCWSLNCRKGFFKKKKKKRESRLLSFPWSLSLSASLGICSGYLKSTLLILAPMPTCVNIQILSPCPTRGEVITCNREVTCWRSYSGRVWGAQSYPSNLSFFSDTCTCKTQTHLLCTYGWFPVVISWLLTLRHNNNQQMICATG